MSATAYDRLAYVGRAYPETHPDRLATIATLYGLQPAPVTRCRVLEIGCGDAANLLPMACTLPGSQFFGFDLAELPIAQGREQAAQLGLRNLRLEALDILDFPPDAGEFDYIIAHGVFSWVPPAVRAAVLALCQRHLAPQGIAYVSFNAYPGWHIREMERGMMLHHLDRVGGGPEEARARQALSVLRFVRDAQSEENVYGKLLTDALDNFGERLRTPAGVAWFHHDLLAEINQPFYLHEFARLAGGAGMQFLSEAHFRLPRVLNLQSQVAAAMEELRDDPLAQEQYLDFVACSPFRRVLLCRSERTPDRSMDPAHAMGMHARGELRPASDAGSVDIHSHAPEQFGHSSGEVTLNHPLAKAAIRLLAPAWPHGYSFDGLLTAARAATGTQEGSADELAGLLITLYAGGLVELSTLPPFSTLEVGERPEASALARLQIQASPVITTLRHQNGALEGAFIRRLVILLDGTRDRPDLLRKLRAWVDSGEAARECAALLGSDGQPERTPTPEELPGWLDEGLQNLARRELLVRR